MYLVTLFFTSVFFSNVLFSFYFRWFIVASLTCSVPAAQLSVGTGRRNRKRWVSIHFAKACERQCVVLISEWETNIYSLKRVFTMIRVLFCLFVCLCAGKNPFTNTCALALRLQLVLEFTLPFILWLKQKDGISGKIHCIFSKNVFEVETNKMWNACERTWRIPFKYAHASHIYVGSMRFGSTYYMALVVIFSHSFGILLL